MRTAHLGFIVVARFFLRSPAVWRENAYVATSITTDVPNGMTQSLFSLQGGGAGDGALSPDPLQRRATTTTAAAEAAGGATAGTGDTAGTTGI